MWHTAKSKKIDFHFLICKDSSILCLALQSTTWRLLEDLGPATQFKL